jgi:hypothetical protein
LAAYFIELCGREGGDVHVPCGGEFVVSVRARRRALEETLNVGVVAEVVLPDGCNHVPTGVGGDDLFHDGVQCPDGSLGSRSIEGIDDDVPWRDARPGGEDRDELVGEAEFFA